MIRWLEDHPYAILAVLVALMVVAGTIEAAPGAPR